MRRVFERVCDCYGGDDEGLRHAYPGVVLSVTTPGLSIYPLTHPPTPADIWIRYCHFERHLAQDFERCTTLYARAMAILAGGKPVPGYRGPHASVAGGEERKQRFQSKYQMLVQTS